jgi:anti-sigma regulatory factor (Ser/Thr protein kinase)
MPHLQCPRCRVSQYSATSASRIADACPVCGGSLEAATKRFPARVGARTLCREFPSTASAVASARHALDAVYAELGDPVHPTTVLLVSELVTNSVKHSRATNGAIELVACITPDVVRVEVSDDGEGFDPPPLADHDAESGRGLQLVQALADRWGRPPGPRTSVWFEIDRSADRARYPTGTGARTPTLTPQLKLGT